LQKKRFWGINEAEDSDMNKNEIELILNELGVELYSIQEDGTVNVNGTVDISFKKLSRIPVSFGVVKGDFNCSNNELETLAGCPKTVGVSFYCHSNRLESLDSSPAYVGKAFICSNNRLVSLEGVPNAINGNFDCSKNRLVSLKSAPRAVRGSFDCSENQLVTLEGIPEYIELVLYCNGNPIPGEVLEDFKNKSLFLILDERDS